ATAAVATKIIEPPPKAVAASLTPPETVSAKPGPAAEVKAAPASIETSAEAAAKKPASTEIKVAARPAAPALGVPAPLGNAPTVTRSDQDSATPVERVRPGAVASLPDIPESKPTAIGNVPQAFGSVGASRVTLTARVDSWVKIRGANSEFLLTRALRAGDKYHVPDRPGLTLMTGNVGAIEIAVDGKTLLMLGAIGEVRRDISLSPEALLSANSAP
ncbi:MAG: DUF4115 domain-containing protein, partial [Alphaproteobacteria bacterium]|nr:DUF4115 domain-containing protein [Alphaproteobacteria bacterium]